MNSDSLVDAVILSDLHLGAYPCQVPALERFLLEGLPPTKELVLNGDTLESTEYQLTKRYWCILLALRKLSDQVKLVWVEGNHDFDAQAVAHLVGAQFVPEYMFQSGGRRMLCVHGHKWDRFLTDHPVVSNVADWFYLRLQYFSRRLAARVKLNSKTFLYCAEKVRKEAVKYARRKGADVVICGHTHHAEELPAPGSCPDYYNTGSWVDDDCHCLIVNDGAVKLHPVCSLLESNLLALPA